VIFHDGRPVIIDVGPEAYTAENSSSRRYGIWTMQSAWHNLPTIGHAMQRSGRAFGARDVVHAADDDNAELAMEIAGAYPADAGLKSWHRTVRLERAGTVRVTERYALSKPVDRMSLTLLTPCAVRQTRPGELSLDFPSAADGILIRFAAEKLRATLERVVLKDKGLQRIWGPELTRILLIADTPALDDTCNVTFENISGSAR
jgi:hypothetical protein